jgi:hypothetical protein
MSSPKEPKPPEVGSEDDQEVSEDASEGVSPEEALDMLPTADELEAEFD